MNWTKAKFKEIRLMNVTGCEHKSQAKHLLALSYPQN